MKWDKAVALSIVILGAFYAGYSGVSYFLKRQTVETTSEAVPKAVVEANGLFTARGFADCPSRRKGNILLI